MEHIIAPNPEPTRPIDARAGDATGQTAQVIEGGATDIPEERQPQPDAQSGEGNPTAPTWLLLTDRKIQPFAGLDDSYQSLGVIAGNLSVLGEEVLALGNKLAAMNEAPQKHAAFCWWADFFLERYAPALGKLVTEQLLAAHGRLPIGTVIHGPF